VGHAGLALDGVRPNKKIYGTIEAWRNRPIEDEHPYVYLDGIVLKRSLGRRGVQRLAAGRDGVNDPGHREILGICEGAKEDKAGCSAFLKERGLRGSCSSPRMPVSGLPRAHRSSSRRRLGSAASCIVQQHLQPRPLDQGAGDRGYA
jgi:transposase-like protein